VLIGILIGLVFVLDGDGNVRQKHLEARDLIIGKVGCKVLTNWNDESQPVGEAAGFLAGYFSHHVSKMA
jgi:hypothetical protein